jgi:hypothetical protein
MGYRRTLPKFRGVRRLKSGFFDRRHYFKKRDAEIARVKRRIEKALKNPSLLLGRRFFPHKFKHLDRYNKNRYRNFGKFKKNTRRRPLSMFELQSRFVQGIPRKKKKLSRYKKYPLYNFSNLFKKFNV